MQFSANLNIKWLILFGVWLVYFSFGLTISGLAPIVKIILIDLKMSHTEMGSVLGAWQLIYIVSAIPCGILVDRIGPRKALFVAAIIMAISGLARSLSSDYLALFLSVALFGLGGPIVSSGAPKLVALWFSGKDRGLAMGVYITGPALAGLLTLSSTHPIFLPLFENSWRSVIQLWSLVTLFIGFFWIYISSHPKSLAIENQIATEQKRTQLQEVTELLKIAPVRIMLFMAVGIFMFNHGLNNWLPELLRANGMSAVNAGYWATIPTIVGVIGALSIPRYASPERRVLILSLLTIAGGCATLFLLSAPGPLLFLGLMLQGIARSSLMTIAILTLVEQPGIGKNRAGTVSGLFFSAAEVGGVGGPIMLGYLYDVTGGFTAGLHMLTIIMIALFFGSLKLKYLASSSQKPR